MNVGNKKKCIRCNEDFYYKQDQCYWDYQGVTPTKVTKCPHCDCLQAIRYEKENNINLDARYY